VCQRSGPTAGANATRPSRGTIAAAPRSWSRAARRGCWSTPRRTCARNCSIPASGRSTRCYSPTPMPTTSMVSTTSARSITTAAARWTAGRAGDARHPAAAFCLRLRALSQHPAGLLATLHHAARDHRAVQRRRPRCRAVLPEPRPHADAGLPLRALRYSTDAAELPEEAFDALRGVDTWLVDCLSDRPHPTHSHIERTLGWIARLRPRRVVLTHMGFRSTTMRCAPACRTVSSRPGTAW